MRRCSPRDVGIWLDRLVTIANCPRALAALFLTQASIAILLLAMLVPPFENSDEFNHYDRADQIASGALVATRYAGPTTSGGVVDRGIDRVDDIVGIVRFHPERKVTGDMLRRAGAIGWGDRASVTFANTAIYAPLLYLPGVLGIWIGKMSGSSIVHTLILSRAMMGISALVPAAVAIAMAGEAAPLLLVLLALPMSLSLFAAVSQDGPMLAAAALTVGLASRGGRSGAALIGLCVCLGLLAIGRPAYAPFAILPLLLRDLPWRRRLLASILVMLPILFWSVLVASKIMINASPSRDIDVGMQLHGLLAHPGRVMTLARAALTTYQGMEGRSYFVEFVGMLGWIDVALPAWFYWLAGAILMLAMATAMVRLAAPIPLLAQGTLFAAALSAAMAIFLLEYLTWTPVGMPIIEGVQGRYFLPVALVLVLCLPALRRSSLRSLADPVRPLLACFPTLSIVVTISSVVHRYYL